MSGSRGGCDFLHPPLRGSTACLVRYYRVGFLHRSQLSRSGHGCNFVTSMPYAVVSLQACGTTVSDFCTDPNSAEVATDVFLYVRAFPNLDYPCLAVVPQGGAVVPRQRFYRPLPHSFSASLDSVAWAVLPQCLAVVPCALAVVPRPRCGSTVLRRLSWWITVGFVLPLYKRCLLL